MTSQPGDLTRVEAGSGLYGPVHTHPRLGLTPSAMESSFRGNPAIVLSIVEVKPRWRDNRIPMVYLLTPDQVGWTWEENVT